MEGREKKTARKMRSSCTSWTQEEKRLITLIHSMIGDDWERYVQYFDERTAIAIRSQWWCMNHERVRRVGVREEEEKEEKKPEKKEESDSDWSFLEFNH
jgi:ribosomal protein L12E/L44/L45/RPP1/RPP2